MADLVRALARHNIAWKKNAHYNLKCRTVVAVPGEPTPTAEVAGRVRGVEDARSPATPGTATRSPAPEEASPARGAQAKRGDADAMAVDGDRPPRDTGAGAASAALPIPGARSPGNDELSRAGSAELPAGSPLGGSLHGSRASTPTGRRPPTVQEIKFEVQIYKVREGEYLVDFQRIAGDLFLYLDVCADVLFSLRI